MKRLLTIIFALGWLCHGVFAANAATAGTSPISYLYYQGPGGVFAAVSATNPLPVTCISGCSSSGSGAAATNYSLETGGNLAAILAAIKAPLSTTAPNNCSGAMTTGGTAQLLIAAGTVHGFEIQDQSGDLMAVSWTTATPAPNTSGSYTIDPATVGSAGGTYHSQLGLGIPTAVYVIAKTTGDAFTCTWW